MSDSLWVHGFWPARLLCPWDSPGKNTRVGCHCLLQGIFPTQGSNPSPLCILHYRQVLYQWDTWEAPIPVRATFFDPRQKFLNNVTLSFSCLQLINDNFLKREHFLGFIKIPFSSLPNSVKLFGYSGLWITLRELITAWICLSTFDSPSSPPSHLCLLPSSSLFCVTPWTSLRGPDCGVHIGNWLLARLLSPLLIPPLLFLVTSVSLLPSSLLHVILWASLGVLHCEETFHH